MDDLSQRGRYGEEAARFDRKRVDETLPAVFRENIGASGDASYTMRRMVPSASGTYATVAGFADPMPAAGEVSVGRIWASEVRTAGTATLRVRITHGGVATDYDLSEIVLDGGTAADGLTTRDNQAADFFEWGSGLQFEAGSTIELRIVTAGTFAPTTLDAGAQLTVTYGDVDR